MLSVWSERPRVEVYTDYSTNQVIHVTVGQYKKVLLLTNAKYLNLNMKSLQVQLQVHPQLPKVKFKFASEDQAHWNTMVQRVSKDKVKKIQMVDSRLVLYTKEDADISKEIYKQKIES